MSVGTSPQRAQRASEELAKPRTASDDFRGSQRPSGGSDSLKSASEGLSGPEGASVSIKGLRGAYVSVREPQKAKEEVIRRPKRPARA